MDTWTKRLKNLEIELEREFKLAEEDSPRGRAMKAHIDQVCYDYTHR